MERSGRKAKWLKLRNRTGVSGLPNWLGEVLSCFLTKICSKMIYWSFQTKNETLFYIFIFWFQNQFRFRFWLVFGWDGWPFGAVLRVEIQPARRPDRHYALGRAYQLYPGTYQSRFGFSRILIDFRLQTILLISGAILVFLPGIEVISAVDEKISQDPRLMRFK